MTRIRQKSLSRKHAFVGVYYGGGGRDGRLYVPNLGQGAGRMAFMRYRLRTLLIVLALGPIVLAGGYWLRDRWRPKPSPWCIDGLKDFVPPPGFKLSQEAARLKAEQADAAAELN